jgi:hypothetical protein
VPGGPGTDKVFRAVEQAKEQMVSRPTPPPPEDLLAVLPARSCQKEVRHTGRFSGYCLTLASLPNDSSLYMFTFVFLLHFMPHTIRRLL